MTEIEFEFKKKEKKVPICTAFHFTCTEKMKRDLEELRDDLDLNHEFRVIAQKLINARKIRAC